MISEQLVDVREKITAAAGRAGRDPAEIRLIAVAKGQPVEKVMEAVQAGVTDIGENYAQEMLEHQEALRLASLAQDQLRWHFIGHLQRNKVKQIIGLVSLIHSVDSIDLAREIDRRAAALDKVQEILIEINLGSEDSKSGIDPEKAPELIRELSPMGHLTLKGLMALPPFLPDPEAVRPYFVRLRQIRDAINAGNVYKTPLTELSMGMTHDFEVAIEEGATIVRVGTGIFGERTKN